MDKTGRRTALRDLHAAGSSGFWAPEPRSSSSHWCAMGAARRAPRSQARDYADRRVGPQQGPSTLSPHCEAGGGHGVCLSSEAAAAATRAELASTGFRR